MKKKNFIKKILSYCFYMILTITFFTSCLSDKNYDKRAELVNRTLPNCEIYELNKNDRKFIAIDTICKKVYVIYISQSSSSISTNNICLLINK